MGYKGTILSTANRVASAGFSFARTLPTYYQGHVLWLARDSWYSLYSQYEPSIGQAIRDNLKPGDIFWDIGANAGWFSLFATKVVGASGKVFSFEPSPDVFRVLLANTRGLASVRPIQCGVGNTDSVATFAAQGAGSSASFVEDVTKINEHYMPDTPITKVEVKIRKVDTLVEELDPPQVAKIDVEGFELEVLRGARDMLTKARPVIIMEIHPPQLELSGGSEAALFAFLKERGYAWEVIDRNPNSLYSIVAKPIANYAARQ